MKPSIKRIIELRASGASYNTIHKETGASKANISYICRKYVPANEDIKTRLAATACRLDDRRRLAALLGHTAYYADKVKTATEIAARRLAQLPDVVVAYMAGLYDGEGNHKSTEFSLSNSDKRLIERFLQFVKQLGLRCSLSLYLHATHDRAECLSYWQLPFDYIRQYDKRKQRRDNNAKENYGTVHARVIKPLGLRQALAQWQEAKLS